MRRKVSKEDALASMLRFVSEHGRYPTRYECNEIDYLHDVKTYFKVLGPMRSLTLLEDIYAESPARCSHCNTVLPYEKRKNKFCNQSCAAKEHNPLRISRKTACDPLPNCLYCGNVLKKRGRHYCSHKCQQAKALKIAIDGWLANEVVPKTSKALKHLVEEIHGHKCSCCGITEWQNKSIVFDLEHKDGNSENNSPDNVCLLCPNCHSQTSTYKGKNKGNGRHSRRLRYAEGKSY
jgi:hypothetical protein